MVLPVDPSGGRTIHSFEVRLLDEDGDFVRGAEHPSSSVRYLSPVTSIVILATLAGYLSEAYKVHFYHGH